MSNKTIIACRPGMQKAMESAFAGMKVVVDDTLDKDYEFREEAMTFDEIMEAEIAKEERQEADPKNAITFCVPLTMADADDCNTWEVPILAIRVERGPAPYDVINTIRTVKPTSRGDFPEYEVNVSATIGEIRSVLKKAGYNVLSISEADGLIALDH